DLNALLATDAPVDLVYGETVDDRQITRIFILDGFDELPHDQLETFVADCQGRSKTRPHRRRESRPVHGWWKL
ncbi:MAG: hypothetical protein O7A06_17630, partial [Acidobacteria bacterium]|nr:hypothetical protein [Acidobacteriota bacterium]